MDPFLSTTLSLPMELEMERDRRVAAHMSRDQMAQKLHEMIQCWYVQHQMINRMLGEIRQLQVKVALAGPPVPSKREPEPHHMQWARDLMGRR